MLLEIKSYGQSETAPYVFLTSCVASTAELIDELNEKAEDATLEEVAFNCELAHFKKILGYSTRVGDGLLTLEDDWHVTYRRSFYRGVPCYYIQHSGIEYIWINRHMWRAESAKEKTNGNP
jgi:hypothetical protein